MAEPVSPPCPVCGKPARAGRLQPFCSTRCADVDLGRWFTGAYAIPAPMPEQDDEGDANPLDLLSKPG